MQSQLQSEVGVEVWAELGKIWNDKAASDFSDGEYKTIFKFNPAKKNLIDLSWRSPFEKYVSIVNRKRMCHVSKKFQKCPVVVFSLNYLHIVFLFKFLEYCLALKHTVHLFVKSKYFRKLLKEMEYCENLSVLYW